jgi:hypothetical protein
MASLSYSREESLAAALVEEHEQALPRLLELTPDEVAAGQEAP